MISAENFAVGSPLISLCPKDEARPSEKELRNRIQRKHLWGKATYYLKKETSVVQAKVYPIRCSIGPWLVAFKVKNPRRRRDLLSDRHKQSSTTLLFAREVGTRSYTGPYRKTCLYDSQRPVTVFLLELPTRSASHTFSTFLLPPSWLE